MQPYVALPSIMTAASINILMMRSNELETGIAVQDANGNDLGVTSKVNRGAFLLAITKEAVWMVRV